MKNVIKSIIFMGLLFLMLQGISYALLPKESLKKFGLIKTSTYEILNEKLDSIDAIFIGDSLIYTSISPLEIWHKEGYSTYAFGSAAQLIDDTFDNLKIAVESQHPKIILFEANVIFRDPKNAPKYSKYKYTKRRDQILPIASHHNNWKNYLFSFVEDITGYSATNDYKGFRYVTDIVAAPASDYMKETDKVLTPISNNIKTLKKIKAYCDNNNVKLVLMSTPNRKSWNYSKYLGTKLIAEELELDYIDLNVGNPLNINWSTETKDKGSHVNYEGAKKVTAYFSNYLKETNLLKDHRGEKEYESWDLAYKRYDKMLNTN